LICNLGGRRTSTFKSDTKFYKPTYYR